MTFSDDIYGFQFFPNKIKKLKIHMFHLLNLLKTLQPLSVNRGRKIHNCFRFAVFDRPKNSNLEKSLHLYVLLVLFKMIH